MGPLVECVWFLAVLVLGLVVSLLVGRKIRTRNTSNRMLLLSAHNNSGLLLDWIGLSPRGFSAVRLTVFKERCPGSRSLILYFLHIQ